MVNKVGRGLTQDRRRRFLPGVRPSVFVLIAALGLASCQTNDTFFITNNISL